MWAVLAALYPAKDHANKIYKYKKYSEALDFTNIAMPVKLCNIAKFEKLNNIFVNVFGYEAGEVITL